MKRKSGSFVWLLFGFFSLLILSGCFFRVIITPPTIALIAPANNATDHPPALLLTWEATPGTAPNKKNIIVTIVGYRVYFARSTEAYGEPENTTEKQIQKTGLELNTQYKWKVIVVQSCGQTAESEEWTFTTQDPHYASPTIALISPVSGATNQATAVTLTWAATPGAQTNVGQRDASMTEYLVYFGLQGSGYGNPATVTSNQQQRTNLAYGTTYKWQVVAIQSDGQHATSTERTFTTFAALYAPPTIALTAPASDATNQATAVTLTWAATPGEQTNVGEREAPIISNYLVYFATGTTDYGTPENAAATQHPLSELAYNTAYKWQVVAVQSDGQRATSTEWSFMTADRLYGAPEIALISPVNGATDQATTVTLTWVATPGAQTNVGQRAPSLTEFRVYQAKTGEAYSSPATTTNDSYELTNLATNTEYTYKVEALQSDGKTAETPEATFMTRSGTVVRYNAAGEYQKSYHQLSAAVNEANGKDTIEVDGGTLLNNETKQITIAGTEVTIRSSNETPFTIDMLQQDRVFEITGGASVTMSCLVITGGAAAAGTHGGGVSITGFSMLTTRHATIASNTANNGGAVYVNYGAFTTIDTTIASNTANNGNGSGVYVTNGTFNADNATIASNTVKGAFRYGGGVYVTNGSFNAVNTTITLNTAIVGGGVYVTNGTFNAIHTTIATNTAIPDDNGDYGNGAGVFVNDGTFTATDSTLIASNTASNNGGGVYLCTSATFNANSITIQGNEAVIGSGGGIYWGAGTINTLTAAWSPKADQQDAFSVSVTGAITVPPDTEHPVQVTGNTAPNNPGTHQMRCE